MNADLAAGGAAPFSAERFANGWVLLRHVPLGEVAIDLVLIQPNAGIALLEIEPRWTSDAPERLRERLRSSGFLAAFPGHLPMIHRRLEPAHVGELADILTEAFIWQPPLSLFGPGAWHEAIERVLTPGFGEAQVAPPADAATVLAAAATILTEARAEEALAAEAAPPAAPAEPAQADAPGTAPAGAPAAGRPAAVAAPAAAPVSPALAEVPDAEAAPLAPPAPVSTSGGPGLLDTQTREPAPPAEALAPTESERAAPKNLPAELAEPAAGHPPAADALPARLPPPRATPAPLPEALAAASPAPQPRQPAGVTAPRPPARRDTRGSYAGIVLAALALAAILAGLLYLEHLHRTGVERPLTNFLSPPEAPLQ